MQSARLVRSLRLLLILGFCIPTWARCDQPLRLRVVPDTVRLTTLRLRNSSSSGHKTAMVQSSM